MKNKNNWPYVRINVDGTLDLISLSEDHFLDDLYAAIGCEFFESVATYISRDFLILCDEDGKLFDGWEDRINYVASHLYPGSDFGDYIVGPVVLARRSGPDLIPLSRYDIRYLSDLYDSDQKSLYEFYLEESKDVH